MIKLSNTALVGAERVVFFVGVKGHIRVDVLKTPRKTRFGSIYFQAPIICGKWENLWGQDFLGYDNVRSTTGFAELGTRLGFECPT